MNIYRFSNENLKEYQQLYNFEGAKVLSVAGSGDQYFSSLLYGAENVELYDINKHAWYYFILKFYAIKYLSYEMFFEYMITNKMKDRSIYNILKEKIICTSHEKDIINATNFFDRECVYKLLYKITTDIKRTIPYLEPEKYYQLQSILKDRELPRFYLGDFFELVDELSQKNYDIILTSNIYNWAHFTYIKEDIDNYRETLFKFNCSEIQALYSWKTLGKYEKLFEGFDIDKIPSAYKLREPADTVISLRQK